MHSASISALCGRLQKKVLSLNVAFTFVLPGIQWRGKGSSCGSGMWSSQERVSLALRQPNIWENRPEGECS
jgi:hypothetical protein